MANKNMNPALNDDNAIILSASSGVDFQPIPEGTHPARCVRMVHIGTVTQEFSGKEKQRNLIQLSWELPYEIIEGGEYDGQPRFISNLYTASLDEKATLRKHLDAWRGKKFNEAELKEFNLSKLIGVACQLTVTHTEKNGKTYSNIAGIAGIPKGMTVPDQLSEGTIVTVNNYYEHKESLSDYLIGLIESSQEFNTVHGQTATQEPAEEVHTPEDANEALPF